jgi:peroxiredoxin
MRQLREFAQRKSEFDKLNVRLIAISADDAEHVRMVWEKSVDRKFPVLSDAGAKVIREYGLLDTESAKGAEIAIRTTLLVDENGIERWRLVSDKVRDVPKPEDVLERLRQQKKQ